MKQAQEFSKQQQAKNGSESSSVCICGFIMLQVVTRSHLIMIFVSIYRVISQLLLNHIVFLSLESWDEREILGEFHIFFYMYGNSYFKYTGFDIMSFHF